LEIFRLFFYFYININEFKLFFKINLLMWPTKKKKTKLAPHKRIWWVGWGRGVFQIFFFYKGANQTEKFTGMKKKNDRY